MRPGNVRPILFLSLLFLSCGSPDNPESVEPSIAPITPVPPVVPVAVSLKDDVATLKEEIISIEAMVWNSCTDNCSPPKVKKLIRHNKVNSPHLENQIIGVEVDSGYSWDKHKYFGSKTMADFLEELLKGNTLKFNLDRLCALNEIIPIADGKFELGNHALVDNPEILTNCGVLFGDLNLGVNALVEDTNEGNFEQKITLDEIVLYLKVTPDIFLYGEYSSETRRRLTYDKVKDILSVETLRFLPGKDSLVRIYFDGQIGETSILNKEVDPEEIEMTYSAEVGLITPHFARLDIKAESLGGVEDEAPEAQACLDLDKGLISQYSFDNCPLDFGLTLGDTNALLLEMNYTPDPNIIEALDFTGVDDVFLKDL